MISKIVDGVVRGAFLVRINKRTYDVFVNIVLVEHGPAYSTPIGCFFLFLAGAFGTLAPQHWDVVRERA